MEKIGRNDPCPCGSGKKYKQCCLQAKAAPAAGEHAGDASSAAHIRNAFQTAIGHFQAGRLAEAAAISRRVLQAEPNRADALHLLGLIARQAGKHEAAAELITKAIRANPLNSAYYSDLGLVYGTLKRRDEAIACYEKALSIDPDHADAHNNLGIVLRDQGKLEEAACCYEKALALKPDHAAAHYNLGNVFRDQDRLDQAAACYRKALVFKPDDAKTHNVLGNVLREQGRLDEAMACYRKGLSLRPDLAMLHHALIYTMNQSAEDDGAAVFAACRRFAEQFEKGIVRLPHRNEPDTKRRIKVGYVSGDFRQHSIAYFIGPVLASHDHREVEIFCYSNHRMVDHITRRLMGHSDHWRSIVDLPDAEVAALMERDGIDILVDLSGHTSHNKLLVFARKPAPVQVTWIGFPNTTGLTAMDYRLTNQYIDPVGLTEKYHSETLVRLSSSNCYRPEAELPPVNELPALSNGRVTFSSFNIPLKVSTAMVAAWSRILAILPDSRLMMTCQHSFRNHVCGHFRANGIEQNRVVFLDRLPVRDYLALHNQVDIALDTFPYNGGTITRNSLWMGVPVVTLFGQIPVSRNGLALLSQVGLESFIANNEEDYVRIAVDWARNLEGLAEIRSALRQRMQEAPFSNAETFTRELEAAYRQMWHVWCARQPASRGCHG